MTLRKGLLAFLPALMLSIAGITVSRWPAIRSAFDFRLSSGFTLQSGDGPVSLSSYRGKVVLVYFGYTFCPDVCPTSLADISAALNQLSPEELVKVAVFFITVDPERDTPQKMKLYASNFHPQIVGLSGTPTEIAVVTGLFGAAYQRQEVPGSAAKYLMDHTSRIYLVGPNGKFASTLAHGTRPSEIAEEIRKILGHTI